MPIWVMNTIILVFMAAALGFCILLLHKLRHHHKEQMFQYRKNCPIIQRARKLWRRK